MARRTHDYNPPTLASQASFVIKPEYRVVGKLEYAPAEFNLENQSAPEWCTPVYQRTATGTEVPLDGQRRSMKQIRPMTMTWSVDVEIRVDQSEPRPRTDRGTVSGRR